MDTFLLTDWITVSGDGGAGVSSIAQSSHHVIAFLEVKQIELGTGGTTLGITYQSAPTKDDSLFVDVTSVVTLAAGLTVTKMLKDSTSNPLSRWLRWKVAVTAGTPTLAWGTTLRIWIAANLSGNRARVPMAPDTQMRMLASRPSTPMGGP